MSDIQIDNCPFCDGNAYLDVAGSGNKTFINNAGMADRTPFLYHVLCENCGARTIPCINPLKAIELWNRRTK